MRKKSKKKVEQDALFIANADQIVREMVDEYGYIFCQFCGRTLKTYGRHHIIFRSERPDHTMLHNKCNILIVGDEWGCNCHRKLHDKKSLRDDIVKRRNLDKIFCI